jgi:hypothetical protein
MMTDSNSTLAARLAESDLQELSDWQAAEVLNAPDPALPEIVTYNRKSVGVAEVMDLLGPLPGAAFLSALEAASSSSQVIYWGLHELKNGGLDVARENVRQQIQALEQNGMLTGAQSAVLLALEETRRQVSWAEHNNVKVTARTVGLARGNT